MVDSYNFQLLVKGNKRNEVSYKRLGDFLVFCLQDGLLKFVHAQF